MRGVSSNPLSYLNSYPVHTRHRNQLWGHSRTTSVTVSPTGRLRDYPAEFQTAKESERKWWAACQARAWGVAEWNTAEKRVKCQAMSQATEWRVAEEGVNCQGASQARAWRVAEWNTAEKRVKCQTVCQAMECREASQVPSDESSDGMKSNRRGSQLPRSESSKSMKSSWMEHSREECQVPNCVPSNGMQRSESSAKRWVKRRNEE
jgi:hypothetical protein